jgi:hypothetical protein
MLRQIDRYERGGAARGEGNLIGGGAKREIIFGGGFLAFWALRDWVDMRCRKLKVEGRL